MKKLGSFIKVTIAGGILFLIPMGVVVLILSKVFNLLSGGSRLEIFAYLDRTLPELERAIGADALALGCTPAINLFPQRWPDDFPFQKLRASALRR